MLRVRTLSKFEAAHSPGRVTRRPTLLRVILSYALGVIDCGQHAKRRELGESSDGRVASGNAAGILAATARVLAATARVVSASTQMPRHDELETRLRLLEDCLTASGARLKALERNSVLEARVRALEGALSLALASSGSAAAAQPTVAWVATADAPVTGSRRGQAQALVNACVRWLLAAATWLVALHWPASPPPPHAPPSDTEPPAEEELQEPFPTELLPSATEPFPTELPSYTEPPVEEPFPTELPSYIEPLGSPSAGTEPPVAETADIEDAIGDAIGDGAESERAKIGRLHSEAVRRELDTCPYP